jgi:putative NIF3 family GTP cyclohydrolase 1 type 2
MNVREVVDVIMAANGGRKFEKTCDQLIEGCWEDEVTGVVTTFMATVDVIHRAGELGANLIITHEPTYFSGQDRLDWIMDDPVYQRKKELIKDNRISIWRYHDHMHLGNADLIYAGLLKTLGWTEYLDKSLERPHCYTVPSTTVAELVEFLKAKLGLKIMRIIGEPGMKCSRIGILVGGGSLGLGQEEMPARLMHEQQLEVMICGEITEWTLSAYVRDAAALGFKKAMIIVGHERSEEPGMQEMAHWLQPLLGDIPVHFVDAREPFIYL